jgi:hypothetical protein
MWGYSEGYEERVWSAFDYEDVGDGIMVEHDKM